MKLLKSRTLQSYWNRFNNVVGTPEKIFLGVSAGLIQFQIEGAMLQSLASIAVVATLIYVILGKVNGTLPGRKLIPLAIIVAFGAIAIFNPDPAHAILFDAETAFVKGITDNIDDADTAKFLSGGIVTVMWLGRAILLGILVWLCIDSNNAKQQGEGWQKILEKPAMYIFSVFTINAIATKFFVP